MNAYDEREEKLGEELMRHLERSILLQVIDNRWREHLFDMDYLREGIHLRGFAQIDPLVAYKNEGFTMFEELMHSIWEEFAKLSSTPRSKSSRAGAQGARRQRRRGTPAALDYSGGTLEASPRRCSRSPRRGARPGGRRAAAQAAGDGGDRQRRRRAGRDRGQRRARQNRPQRPLLVRQRQEVQEVPRRLSDRRGLDAHP